MAIQVKTLRQRTIFYPLDNLLSDARRMPVAASTTKILRVKGEDPRSLLTNIVLAIFPVHGLLIARGDEMVAPLALSSSRWQVLGAIVLSEQAPTCPQIAQAMGMSRQGALKQLKLLRDQSLVETADNGRRSHTYHLTRAGQQAYGDAMGLNARWTARLVKNMSRRELRVTLSVLGKLESQLKITRVPKKEKRK